MTITLLITLIMLLGFFLAGAIGVIISQSRELFDLEWSAMQLRDELDEAHRELSELRCEYERALGGTSYQWRPVNRVFGSKPR